MVVYLYIPTSNHNPRSSRSTMARLYIFIFLHQTTTHIRLTLFDGCCISLYSYIKPQPYRAFTIPYLVVYLYIPTSNHNYHDFVVSTHGVVYLYIPTSNHNSSRAIGKVLELYIFIFLHQTTTFASSIPRCLKLYIFIFLHQTTTCWSEALSRVSCISLYSYIKPQHLHIIRL